MTIEHIFVESSINGQVVITNPYWYQIIKSYEQKCTLKTKTRLKQYVLHLNQKCDSLHKVAMHNVARTRGIVF